MSTKVLVFESDAGFASELRSELGKLGCTTSIVDDGNVGLQQASVDRPDLILLSIELPRMNGFSVCNKLKKDPNLKDVPLIIMSSESNDETFEQHKKLRTRAEDYVHKPIGFVELLGHIQAFVPLAAAGLDSESAIVIDDEIDIGSIDYYADEDVVEHRSPAAEAAMAAQTAAERPSVDADVDAFAESAFGRLTSASNGAFDSVAPVAPVAPTAFPPPLPSGRKASVPARAVASVPPASLAIVGAELDRVRDELARARGELARALEEEARLRADQARWRERTAKAESDAEELRGEFDRLRLEAGEAERLAREVEDLKARIAAGPRAGAVSSREFLDLREALNKKDKEILALREHLSRKDKEIVESQDKMISLERGKADLEDHSLAIERELAEARDKIDALSADKDLAKKLAEDLKVRLEKARVEIESRDKALAEAKTRYAEDIAARDAKLVETKQRADEALAAERAARAEYLEHAEERLRSELEQATRVHESALAEVRDDAARDKAEALSAQEALARQEFEVRAASLQAAQAEELDRRLAEMQAEAERRRQATVDRLRTEHARQVAEIESDRDSRIAGLEAKGTQERADAEARVARLDAELTSARSELDALRQAKQASDAAAEVKKLDLENRLAESIAAREDLERRLDETTTRATSLDATLTTTKVDLVDTRERLAAETSRADRSAAIWEAARRSLERAKDALAVALQQIEEAEARTA